MPYIDVFKLMEYANNMADKSIDANDIARFPWADVVERKKGHWIRMREQGDSRFMCSVCKSKENVPVCNGEPTIWCFCPNCGADMRGGPDAQLD